MDQCGSRNGCAIGAICWCNLDVICSVYLACFIVADMTSRFFGCLALALFSTLSTTQAALWDTPRKTFDNPLTKSFQKEGNVLTNKGTRIELDVTGGMVVGVYASSNNIKGIAQGLAIAWGMSSKELPKLEEKLSSKDLQKAIKKGFVESSGKTGQELIALKKTGNTWKAYAAVRVWPEKTFPPNKNGIGNAKAANVVRVFSDFQCPYCQRLWNGQLAKWEKQPKKYVTYHYQFPLNFHENAFAAAEASECAGAQGKFQTYANKLFHDEAFPEWSKTPNEKVGSVLQQYAKSTGLDTQKFKTCMKQHTYKNTIQEHMRAGQILGVQGTPSVFLNGVRVSNPNNTREINAIRNITTAKPSALQLTEQRLKSFR